jgi:hypothetical protein
MSIHMAGFLPSGMQGSTYFKLRSMGTWSFRLACCLGQNVRFTLSVFLIGSFVAAGTCIFVQQLSAHL